MQAEVGFFYAYNLYEASSKYIVTGQSPVVSSQQAAGSTQHSAHRPNLPLTLALTLALALTCRPAPNPSPNPSPSPDLQACPDEVPSSSRRMLGGAASRLPPPA